LPETRSFSMSVMAMYSACLVLTCLPSVNGIISPVWEARSAGLLESGIVNPNGDVQIDNLRDGAAVTKTIESTATMTKPTNFLNRPVIGILMLPVTTRQAKAFGINLDNVFVPTDYVSFFEAAGARIAPIYYTQSRASLRNIFGQINGLVIPGGTLFLEEGMTQHPRFRMAANYLLELAKQANDNGHIFPVHGTCLGFEFLVVQTAEDDDVLCKECFATKKANLNLKLMPAAKTSELFGNLAPSLQKALVLENTTFFGNSHGITLSTFKNISKLTHFWNVLSTTHDLLGLEFVSTLEAKRYPFTATQWHQKNQPLSLLVMWDLR